MTRRTFFTPDPQPARRGTCWGCGRAAVPQSAEDRRAFKDFLGMTWPRAVKMIGINVRRDHETLGLPTAGCPADAPFCARCAVAYMTEFNRLNAIRKEKEKEEKV
jgi:hypothetical protein